MLKHLRYILATCLLVSFLTIVSSCDHWLEPNEPVQPTVQTTPIEFREIPR